MSIYDPILDPVVKQEVSEWLEPSDVGSELMKHFTAMRLCEEVPVYKAFGLGPDYNVGMLKKIAEGYKPKKIVIVDHGASGFEIRRLGNNDSVNMFYASLAGNKLVEFSEDDNKQTTMLRNVIKDFMFASEESLAKYDANGLIARSHSCISYTYIQRRLASVSVFRKDSRGASEAIKAGLAFFEKEGFIKKLESFETSELMNVTAQMYRINKELLDDKQA